MKFKYIKAHRQVGLRGGEGNVTRHPMKRQDIKVWSKYQTVYHLPRLKRFSTDISMPHGITYINSQVKSGLKDISDQTIDNSLDFSDDVLGAVVNHEHLGKTRGVKRYGRFAKQVVSYLKSKRKKENKK